MPIELRIGQTMGSKVKLDVALCLVYPDNQRDYHAEVTRRLQELNDTVTRTDAPNLASEKYPMAHLLNLQRLDVSLK